MKKDRILVKMDTDLAEKFGFAIKLLCLLFIMDRPLYAKISPLINEFLRKNSTLQQISLARIEAKLVQQEVESRKSWSFLGGGHYNDDRLDGSGIFSGNNTITKGVAIGLKKDNFLGQSLTYQSQFVFIDKSRWNSLLLGGSDPKTVNFEHVFGLKQELGKNIFGYADRFELNKALLSDTAFNMEADKNQEQLVKNFNSIYIKTKMDKTNFYLKKEALKRAIKLKNLVKKRVQDGLREEVDLLEAEINVKGQEEKVKLTQQEVLQDLKSLSDLLHRSVREEEITLFSFNEIIHQPKYPHENQLNGNKEILTLEKQIDLIRSESDFVDLQMYPNLELQVDYKVNAYHKKFDESFSKSTPGEDTRQWQVALNLIWPIGFGPQKVAKQRAHLKLKSKEIELESIKKNIKESKRQIAERIGKWKDLLGSSHVRRTLAKRALQEQNKLYNLGRRELDSVIRSEVELINTEEGLIGYLGQLEHEVCEYIYLHGELTTYLLKSKN